VYRHSIVNDQVT